MVTGSLSVCCQKFRPNTLGQQGTTVSSVTLVCNLQLLYWQGQGQNQDLWLQISTSTKMLFLSPFIFLKTNLRRKHRHNCCSLTTIREKMQLSIFLVPSSVWCNLTNEEDSRQSVPPLHGPQSCLATSCWRELLHTASIKSRGVDFLKSEPGTDHRWRGHHSSEVQSLSIGSSFPAVDSTLSKPLHNNHSRQLKEEGED